MQSKRALERMRRPQNALTFETKSAYPVASIVLVRIAPAMNRNRESKQQFEWAASGAACYRDWHLFAFSAFVCAWKLCLWPPRRRRRSCAHALRAELAPDNNNNNTQWPVWRARRCL